VYFDQTPDGGGGRIEIDVLPFCINVDHICAIVDDLPDLFLVFFGGICVGSAKVVCCNEILDFTLVYGGGKNNYCVAFVC
jgi:hypothetical protein